MKVIPTEEIEWETVVANARTGHVQRTEALCIAFPPAQFAPGHAGREKAG